MNPPVPSRPVSLPDTQLETVLSAVEIRLAALGDALRSRDSVGIDVHATELHRALAMAVEQFASAARKGSVPPALRNRLANTSGQVAAQRESLARATAALDRAIEVLIPRDGAGLYSTYGSADRSARGGSILA
jgi:hypothetical protein